jgi:hypothetical protein
MIAVAMGGVDRRQILSARHDPNLPGRAPDSVALPRNSVDEIGGHGRSFSPGGKSLVIAGMLGARNTFQLKDIF